MKTFLFAAAFKFKLFIQMCWNNNFGFNQFCVFNFCVLKFVYI